MAYYGKYLEREMISGFRRDGTEYNYERPAGYTGLFRGHVTDIDGNKLDDYNACDYFLTLRNPENNDLTDGALNFETWDMINDQLSNFIGKHMPKQEDKYHWQCGFGGDESDGLIDFFCKQKVKLPPPMIFEVYGKKYEMTWTYSGDSDRD
jgi:hypothetical protein